MTKDRDLKLYFPNLNGLRFIAACFVIINHVEQLKIYYKIGNGVLSQSVRNIGKLGVMLFFVLSGFLITYLLLSEERSHKTIHVRKFYIRRFLRIAPLYALIIFLVFFVVNNIPFLEIPGMKNPIEQNFYTILGLHIIFLPNLTTAIYGFLPYIAQVWSVGTEEQSYLLWPLLLKKFKKSRLALMFGIISFYIFIRIFLKLFSGYISNVEIIQKFWSHFNIDTIAIGGVFAILLFCNHQIVKFIVNRFVFYGILFVTVMMLYKGVYIPYFHYLSYSILFGILIVNLAANKNLSKVLEWSVINYLGQISYGIYMYHFLVLIPALILVSKLNLKTNWIIYPLVLIGTIGISAISYHYFERIFLKLKTNYSLIKTGGSRF